MKWQERQKEWEIVVSLQKARIAEVEKLLREGVEGFGSILVQTSDQAGVNDWRRRAREVLDHE